MAKGSNDELYSKLLADKTRSKTKYSQDITAIEGYVFGKKVEEVSKTVDTVTGSTLKDTEKYVQAITKVAKESK